MTQSYTLNDGIAEIRWSNPPVDSLSLAVRESIHRALSEALADPEVKAVILAGSGKNFSGGADVREFNTPAATSQPDLVAIEELCDAAQKPVIAAIAGVALGGGLEIALACHMRVAAPSARLGLPEVKLGVLPGAGGTQRLPRLVSAEKAIALMTSGSFVNGTEAKEIGLVDEIGDDPVETARRLAADHVKTGGPLRRARDLSVNLPSEGREQFFDKARKAAQKPGRGAPAPARIVDCVEAAANRSFDEGLAFERQCFAELVESPESAALRHVFFSERAASRIADLPPDTPRRKVELVGIVGSGTMGTGIALAFANGGYRVRIFDANNDALDRSKGRAKETYDSAVSRGRMGADEARDRFSRLNFVNAIEELADVDLVIEAVFENMDVKRDVFQRLDRIVRQGAILATNTSFLDVNEIAAQTSRPKDVIGLHFFSPANIMRLLEIVRADKTAPDVLATAMEIAKKIGKVGVVSGVCDGFIGNRMVERYALRGLELVAEGASPQQVDEAIEKFGMAMGPFAMSDLAGNDISWLDRKRRIAENPDYRSPGFADELCEMGWFGQKTGQGWYKYQKGDRSRHPNPEAEELIVDWRKRNGITPRTISDDEIVQKCIYALTNEGAKILQEGIAQRSSDIDTVYVSGYGFPAHKGGPMFYAEQVGLGKVLDQISTFHAQEPDAGWEPASLLRERAHTGRFAAVS
ncbi:3-hydroxyacyl-CoA dehydrogenase NAD-binding domain-containing protein [Microvirga sp. P5_D2]